MKRLSQGIENKAGVAYPAHPPADDAAGIGVNDKGDIDETSPSGHVGEVRDLLPVRCRIVQLAIDLVEHVRCGLVADCRADRLAANPNYFYEGIYCARRQAENLIKQRKVQFASGRPSCQSPLANRFRLLLHSAAYWLMLALRDAGPAFRVLDLNRLSIRASMTAAIRVSRTEEGTSGANQRQCDNDRRSRQGRTTLAPTCGSRI